MANEYCLEKAIFTEEMKSETKSIMEWLRDDYKKNGDKIGRMKAQSEFEEYYETKRRIDENGREWITSERDTTKPVTYECIIYIFVPLKGMGFAATDRHKYRWNAKYNRFEHEETEVI